MAQVINTNVLSLNAQRNLTTSQSSLATSLQRLSSGLRINSAKDDAAGLAISDRFTTQINGLNQAVRNASDGISLAQTTESALGELTNNLQRIREIAVQSANASNSASDRQALDQEVQQRLAEVERIATQTAFNGQKVLNGTFGNATFQVGANVGETITVGLSTSMRTTAIGRTADYVNGSTQYVSTLAVGQQGTGVDVGNALASGDLNVQIGSAAAIGVVASVDNSAGAGNAGRSAASAYSKVQAINASAIPNLTATADTTVAFDFVAITDTDSAYTLTINGQGVYTTDGNAISGTQMASQINANAASTGVTATFDSANGRITLNASDGRDIAVSQTASTANGVGQGLTATTAAFNNSTNDALTAITTAAATAVANTYGGTIRLTSTDSITLSGAHETYAGYADNSSMALGSSALNSISVSTVAGANTTLGRVDSALTAVSSLRSTLGAIQNRFESTISSLSAVSENLQASRSRILDADYAAETANLTRAQILQQAGTAILAQANAAPQSVLALLR
ncbi:MAG: flagellin [Gammaproteobacteria bacterium]